MFSVELHGSRRERALSFSRVHRGETVTTQHGQPCRQGAGLVATGPPRSSAHVEVKLVPHDQESAAGGLDIVGVPVALSVGYGTKRPPIRTRPMPAIPAVAQHDVVWLMPVRGLTTPDGEEADEQTLVSHGIQVIEL